MRVYLVDLTAELHNIRGHQADYSLVYHNDDYAAGHQAQLPRRLGHRNRHQPKSIVALIQRRRRLARAIDPHSIEREL